MEAMKHKRLIIILSVVLVVCAALVLTADRIARRVAMKQLARLTAENELMLTLSDMQIRLLHGSVRMDTLSVSLALPDTLTGDTTFVDLTVPRLYVAPIHWLTLARKRIVRIGKISITDASVALRKKNDQTRLSVDSLNLTVRDIRYSIADTTLTYNDSLYHISAAHVDYTTPDGLFRAVIGSLLTENAGGITLTDISGGNTDKKEEHADRMGKCETTWAQFKLRQVSTSPVNIVRMVQQQQLSLDSLRIDGQQVDIYYDTHYPPKQPYPLPQQSLEAVKMPLQINHMTAALGKLHIGMTTDAVHAGYLDLMHTNARIANISNTPGSTMHAALTTHFAGGGDIRVATDMTVNKRCALTFDADMTNVKGSSLTSIAKPLYGVEIGCNFHSISTRCHGDKDTLGGTFCMRYDSLRLHVDDKGPIKELSSLSGLINTFATVVLFDKNPRFPDQEPKAFTVSASYDPMQPFPAYFIAAIVDGMAQTVMPFGLGKGIMNKKKP